MPQIEAKSKVLESKVSDLLGGEHEAGVDEEIVDLNADDTAAAAAAVDAKKPAAKKPAADAAAASGEDDIPAEYKGKTPAELIRMHKEAQSLIGRQGSELGDFRKKADMLIQASLANIQAQRSAQPAAAATPAEEPMEDSAIFAAPVASISKLIENHPVIKEIRATLGKGAADREVEVRSRAAERFNQTHPDAPAILVNPEFQKWVSASRVRTGLLQRAHTNYDFEAGNEVFGTWKELQAARTPAAEAAAVAEAKVAQSASDAGRALAAAKGAKRAQALADAAAPTGGNGSAGEKKKIYRRADVLKLMETEPARYEQLADEISLAYKEGRVK